MPKAILNQEEYSSLDDALKGEYEENGDVFTLKIDGFDEHPSVKNLKSAHERQKGNNTGLKDELSKLKEELSKFEGVDLEEVQSLRERAREAENKEHGLTDEQVTQLLENRFGPQKKALESERDKLQSRTEELEGVVKSLQANIEDMSIFGEIESVALEAGARKKALRDIRGRAKEAWKMHEGTPMAFKPDGEPWFGKDAKPITMKEWVAELSEEDEFLFEPNRGAGAQGNENTNGTGTVYVDSTANNAIGRNLEEFADGSAQLR